MKKNNKKPERYTNDKKPLVHSEPERYSTVTNNTVSRIERRAERERLENRGIY